MRSNDRREYKDTAEHQEIDLFDLLLQLWKGKKVILGSMFFALIIAIAYLVFHKPSWVSTAVVSQPNAGQVADYTNTMLALYPSSISNENTTNKFLPSVFDIRSGAFERFSALLTARIAPEPYKKTVSLEALKMVQSQPQVTSSPLQIRYVADSPEHLDKKLRSLLDQINEEVDKQLVEDLKTSIALRKQELTSSLAIQEKLAQEQRAQRLDEVEQAMQTTAAKREAMSVVIRNDSGQQLNYADEYLKTQEQLLKLVSLEPEKMNIDTFYYVIEPGTPVVDERAPDALIVLLALILGAVVGASIILANAAIRNYKQR